MTKLDKEEMMRLIRGLSEEKLFSRMKRFARLNGLSERALGFYLLDFEQRGLYKKQGCTGMIQFALLKLQIPIKKTRELLRTARALKDLSLIDEAFAAGRLSWSAVREITRVAMKETENEWLEFAEGNGIRKIERAVSRARRGEAPPRDPYSLTRNKLKVIAEMPLEDYAVWKAAFDRLAASSGDDLDVSSALLFLARSFLERPLKKEEKEARQAFQVVYHRCSECDRAWMETADGPSGVSPAKVKQCEEKAEVIHLEKEESELAGVGAGDPRGSSTRDNQGTSTREIVKPNTSLIRQQRKKPLYTKTADQKVPRGTFWEAGIRHFKEEEDTTLYSLDEIPDRIDSAWWRKHAHNFVFKGNRIVLKEVM